MNFTVASAPWPLHLLAAVVLLACLSWQARRVDWRVQTANACLHRVLAAVLIVAMLWSLKGQLAPGFNLHLMGATLAALVFGLPLASFVLSGGVLIATLAMGGDWLALPLNILTAALLPAWVSVWVRCMMERYLPAHLFVYIFIGGFLSAALGVLAVGVVATAILALSQPLDWLIAEYTPFFLLLAFAESWLTGMGVTLMVVYCPGWMSTFDDRRYLAGK